MTWGFREHRWHLLDLVRERLDFPDLKRRVRAQAERWEADLVLIEQAGSGYPLMQQLRFEDRVHGARYQYRKPRADKVTRFEAQTANLETGRYLIPAHAPWLEEFRRELLAFPSGKYDDQVDSLVQFLDWAASQQGSNFVCRDPRTGRSLSSRRPPGRPFR
jgi:predicted phage terminase large subunit-like protein